MAILIDAVSSGNTTGTSLTFSHTCSGNKRILWVGITAGSSDVVSGVTYDGVAMSRKNIRNNGNSTSYLYYLVAPNTGAHDVVVSTTGSVSIFAESASFTGVRQTNPIDAETTSIASATTSCDNTVTTTVDGCVHIASFAVDSVGVSSITNGTQVNAFMGYSAIKTPAGSSTLTGVSGGNNAWASTGAAFAPDTEVESGYFYFM